MTDRSAITHLTRACLAALPIALTYQDIEAELATLPGKYAPL